MSKLISAHPTGSGIQVRLNWIPDEKNAAGMQEIVALIAKDAPLDYERERLQEFFRVRLAAVRAAPDADYTEQMRTLLDYRLWWRFTISFRRGPDQPWETLTSKAHGSLSGGEKAVCYPSPVRRCRVLLRLGRGPCGRTRREARARLTAAHPTGRSVRRSR